MSSAVVRLLSYQFCHSMKYVLPLPVLHVANIIVHKFNKSHPVTKHRSTEELHFPEKNTRFKNLPQKRILCPSQRLHLPVKRDDALRSVRAQLSRGNYFSTFFLHGFKFNFLFIHIKPCNLL